MEQCAGGDGGRAGNGAGQSCWASHSRGYGRTGRAGRSSVEGYRRKPSEFVGDEGIGDGGRSALGKSTDGSSRAGSDARGHGERGGWARKFCECGCHCSRRGGRERFFAAGGNGERSFVSDEWRDFRGGTKSGSTKFGNARFCSTDFGNTKLGIPGRTRQGRARVCRGKSDGGGSQSEPSRNRRERADLNSGCGVARWIGHRRIWAREWNAGCEPDAIFDFLFEPGARYGGSRFCFAQDDSSGSWGCDAGQSHRRGERDRRAGQRRVEWQIERDFERDFERNFVQHVVQHFAKLCAARRERFECGSREWNFTSDAILAAGFRIERSDGPTGYLTNGGGNGAGATEFCISDAAAGQPGGRHGQLAAEARPASDGRCFDLGWHGLGDSRSTDRGRASTGTDGTAGKPDGAIRDAHWDEHVGIRQRGSAYGSSRERCGAGDRE